MMNSNPANHSPEARVVGLILSFVAVASLVTVYPLSTLLVVILLITCIPVLINGIKPTERLLDRLYPTVEHTIFSPLSFKLSHPVSSR